MKYVAEVITVSSFGALLVLGVIWMLAERRRKR